ncbi:MAG: hypothetical protein BWX80_00328 [Candidatus Hydrogenedentes bacterium ADurb.Bin101]|nr:MAG: hypothetical protein BWX80_00328 [Candidatus Hydrogenedentes bacterium ADurb.Bin101]
MEFYPLVPKLYLGTGLFLKLYFPFALAFLTGSRVLDMR